MSSKVLFQGFNRRSFIKKASAAAAIGLIGPFDLASQFRLSQGWQQATSMPHALQEIYCAELQGGIHLAGGFIFGDGSAEVSSHHLRYDTIKDYWEFKEAIPQARHHLQMVSHKGRLYGMGGFIMASPESVWNMQDQTWEYDPTADTWKDRSTAPEKHGETVGASLGDRIHLVGGRVPKSNSNAVYGDHKDSDHHLVYDPGTDTWEKAAPALRARNSAAGAVIDGLWYLVGGRTVGSGNLNDMEVYDPKEDKWRLAAPMPQAQGGLAASAAGGKLFAYGGEYFSDGGGVYKECWSYDPKRDHWEAGEPMLTPRHGLAGASVGNRIYAIGGAKKAGGNETSDLVEFWDI